MFDAVRERGEILDLVRRREPVSLRSLMDEIGMYSEDGVFTALQKLEEEGRVSSRDGDLEEDGTTATVYEFERWEVTSDD